MGKIQLHKPQSVTNAVSGVAPLDVPRKMMVRQGESYVLSTGQVFRSSDITPEYIYNLKKKNAFFKGTLIKQKNLIFRKQVVIEATDKNGKRDDRVTAKLKKRFLSTNFNIWNAMRQSFDDVFCYGISIWNPYIEWRSSADGLEYYPVELRHLPTRTFQSIMPTGSSTTSRNRQSTITSANVHYSELFDGIQFNMDTKQIEYHQTWGGDTKQVTNIIAVKDPSSEDFGGEPLAMPIIPIIEMIKYVLKTVMQEVNMSGSPLAFITITQPKDADSSNGGVSDEDYAKTILQGYGKDTLFILRENMTFTNIPMTISTGNVTIVEFLVKQIVEYFSPASSLGTGGSLFGGTGQPELDLVNAFINGIHDWLESAYQPICQEYLDVNRYDGYTAVVTIPEPETDQTTTNIQKALAGFSTQALQKNEIRLLLNEEELDLEELKKLKEEYAPPPQQPGMFGSGFSYQPGELKRLQKETPMLGVGLSQPRVEVGLPSANTFRAGDTIGSDAGLQPEAQVNAQPSGAEMKKGTIQDDIADMFNEENPGGTYDRAVNDINDAVKSLGDDILDIIGQRVKEK